MGDSQQHDEARSTGLLELRHSHVFDRGVWEASVCEQACLATCRVHSRRGADECNAMPKKEGIPDHTVCMKAQILKGETAVLCQCPFKSAAVKIIDRPAVTTEGSREEAQVDSAPTTQYPA